MPRDAWDRGRPGAQAHADRERAPAARRQARPLRRVADADRVRGRARRAPRGARAGRAVRPHPSGEGRRDRSRRRRDAAARRHERPVQDGGRRGGLQPGPERRRRGDRGPDRLSPRARAVLRGAERIERPARVADAGGGARGRPAPPDVPPGLVLPGRPGPRVRQRDERSVPRGRGIVVHAVHGVGVSPAPGHRDPLGLHGRGRLRALHVSGHRAGTLERPVGGDGAVRGHAVRPGRARRAAARDGLSALRSGPVRVLDRVGGGPRLGSRVRQGRVPRAGGPAAAT